MEMDGGELGEWPGVDDEDAAIQGESQELEEELASVGVGMGEEGEGEGEGEGTGVGEYHGEAQDDDQGERRYQHTYNYQHEDEGWGTPDENVPEAGPSNNDRREYTYPQQLDDREGYWPHNQGLQHAHNILQPENDNAGRIGRKDIHNYGPRVSIEGYAYIEQVRLIILRGPRSQC